MNKKGQHILIQAELNCKEHWKIKRGAINKRKNLKLTTPRNDKDKIFINTDPKEQIKRESKHEKGS